MACATKCCAHEQNVKTVEEHFETVIKQPSARVWKALVVDGHCVIPTIMPDHFQSIEVVEGKVGHSGCIWHVKYGSKSHFSQHGQQAWAKFKYEEIDHSNYVAKYRIMEGGALGKLWHSFIHTIKLVAHPSHPHHTVVQHTIKCDKIGDHEKHLAYKEIMIHTSTSIEAYLVANPNYGCVTN